MLTANRMSHMGHSAVSEVKEHPVIGIVGLLFLGAFAYVLLASLPDLVRYVKINRM